ncbi:MAG: hypothetical protein Edafosvirus11_20 [Edafosvirus sp.]|uniref:Uncharacterized protein n=1 Tax=Edafosvirus sp. TaxID=2487765 RepID=A0A3G4ZU13_9VIRU|nr:MAG: hypothetical protein Edafosvirus11_20 [Edafosvirus sp.]
MSTAGISLIILLALVIAGLLLLCKLPCCNKLKTSKQKKSGNGNITLPHRIKGSSFEAFGKELHLLKDCKTITIIINCQGGSANDCDRYIEDILYHKKKYKCKFIARVEKYALSAGSQIALCCDEIIATEHSYFSPCDTQIFSAQLQYSIPCSDIEDIIELKKEKVHEEFVHLRKETDRIKRTTKQIFDRMVSNSVITHANKEVIFEEFFSGKNSHTQYFSVIDVKRFGIDIKIKNDEIKSDVDDVTIEIDDKKDDDAEEKKSLHLKS